MHTPGNYMVQPEKFRENLEEIIERAKKITERIVFMALKNCDESKTMPVSWIDMYYTNKNMEKYNRIMKEVCEQKKVPFLDIDLFDKEDFDDGLHLNAIGHEKVFNQILNFLMEKMWI
jgi:lysophospholipase L1-like esterase